MTAEATRVEVMNADIGPEAGGATAHHRPLPRRRRGLFWTGVLVALAALVGGTLVSVQAWQSESAPDTAAVDYFHALARGDAPAALGLGDVPSGVHSYLTREVLRASLHTAGISDVRVLSVAKSGRTATVTLQYQLNYASGPVPVTDSVNTVRHGRSWRLTATAVPVQLRIEADSARMSIGGAAVPTQRVLFFPGAVPISLDTPNLSVDPVVAHLNGGAPKSIQPKVSSAGEQAIDRAVAAAITRCISGKPSGGCPSPDNPAGVVPGSVRGVVTGDLADHLNIQLVPDANGLVQISGVVNVKGTYQQLDFDNQPQRKSGTAQLNISAQCYVTDPGRLVWEATP